MLPRIKSILSVEPYSIKCLWTTGEVRIIDLEYELKGKELENSSPVSKLLNEEIFKSVKLDNESGTVYWDRLMPYKDLDGTIKKGPLDFCPDVLYSLSKPV
ncbi:MAG: hypothetical protein WCL14_01735 [Bacteroidota bacterium]